MIRTDFVLFLSLSCSCCFAQPTIAGEYRTNFSTYGMFAEKLILNCDSTALLNFAGDLMNDNSNAKWSFDKNILIVAFDTTKTKSQRYQGVVKYKLKHKKLYRVIFSSLQEYNELRSHIPDSLQAKVPTYKAYQNLAITSMKDFKGTKGVQYLKKVKSYRCK